MLVPYTTPEGEESQYHLSDWLCSQLDKIKRLIMKRDRDYVMIIDGPEGSGKSTLASQCARYVDPTFDESRMALNPDEFIEQVNKCSKQAVVYDEAFVGLGSASVLSPVNKLLVEMMMEMRKKNLFVILVIPSLFYLNKYSALHRAQVLLHTYFSRGKPGAFASYNTKKLQTLYLYGKRKMSYSYPRVSIRQRFIKRTPIDWKTYEARKITSLKSKDRNKTSALHERQLKQRDAAFQLLKEKSGLSRDKIVEKFKEYGLDVGSTTIFEAWKRAESMKKSEKEVEADVQMPATV